MSRTFINLNLSQRIYNKSILTSPTITLIDSATSGSTVKDRSMLSDVQHYKKAGFEHPLTLHTNGGPFVYKYVGKLPGLGQACVWWNPSSIANVLALSDIAKEKRVTMDSDLDKAFIVHGKNMFCCFFVIKCCFFKMRENVAFM